MSTQGAEKKFTNIVDSILQFYDASRSPKSEVGYLPSTISIEPTNRCNLRCLHCHHADPAHPSRQKSGFMDMAVYRKIIDEIRHWASHITLNVHGEPLLHKNIVEMVRYAKEGGLSVSLLTNATMLKPEVTHALVEAQLDRIVFSFEGSCSEIHEKVRYGSNFKRTLGNILYFMVHNQRYGTPPTFICMSMVDSMYTHEDSQAYKDYFSKLPINTIFMSKALNFSGATLFGREVPVSQKIHLPFHEQPACRAPWEVMTVCWDGSVSACPIDIAETHIIGNVATESLEAIWNSDRMQKFRQCHIDRDFEWIEAQGTLCSGCNARLDDPEYDLFNSRDLVLKKIVRQAQVYSQQLAGGESIFESSDVSSQKLAFAEEELQKNSQR